MDAHDPSFTVAAGMSLIGAIVIVIVVAALDHPRARSALTGEQCCNSRLVIRH